MLNQFNCADIPLNPLVPNAHYSECPDKQVSLQIKFIEATLHLNCGFYFLHLGD